MAAPSSSQAECLADAGLRSRVLLPTDTEYTARQDSYWSKSAPLHPACIVQPRTAEEVATAVKALVTAGHKFAVRSGGHTNWAGSNDIEGGVTIDLVHLGETVYHPEMEMVDIGPGARWRSVYTELDKYGRVVAGGREGNVGVAGLLLGGGNAFFTARYGFSCDNVVAYEVVLANGEIVTATAENNVDLFRVLKGGSNNFGIVTKFTMTALKCDKVWGGMTISGRDQIPNAIESISAWTDNEPYDVDSNLICIITHIPDFKDIVVVGFIANVAGVPQPPAYEKWMKMPQIMNSTKMTTIAEMGIDYNMVANLHSLWFTCSFKNDIRILKKASDLHSQLVEELKAFIPDSDFTSQCLFQPLPMLFSQNCVKAGGNMLGIERNQTNGFLFLGDVMVKTAEQEAFAKPKVQQWIKDIKAFAATIDGGNLDWVYLNYSDPTQDPLSSYGAENIKKMKDAAAKYDQNGVFQKLCPGGFKVSKVKLVE